MIFLRRFFARKHARDANRARKKSDEIMKLHLTHSSEKLNSRSVIKSFLHDFARNVRLDEGVIFNAS